LTESPSGEIRAVPRTVKTAGGVSCPLTDGIRINEQTDITIKTFLIIDT
jgi:hypothetical protein